MKTKATIKRASQLEPEEAIRLLDGLSASWQRDFHLGLALWRAGRVDEAIEAHRRAAEAAPTPAPALYMGLAASDAGRIEELRRALERARSVSSENPLVGALAVILRFDEGDPAGALESMGEDIGASPAFLGRILARIEREILRRRGRVLASDEPQIIRRIPERIKPEKLLRRGFAMLEQQRLSEAKALLAEALNRAPQSKDIQYAYGVSLIFFEPRRAVELLRGCEQKGEQQRLHLAMAHCAGGEYEKALELLQDLKVREAPDIEYEAHYVRGLCFVARSMMREAGEAFSAVVDYEPEMLIAQAELLRKLEAR